MTDASLSPLKALLFDLDGTLADTEGGGHRPAYNAAFRELGLPWAWGPALYRRLLGQPGGRERVKHYAEQYDDAVPRSDEEVHALVDQVHRKKSAHYEARLKAGKVRLRPGVRRLVQQAGEAGLQVAIVTNGSAASVDSFLEHCLPGSLRKNVDLVVCPEHCHAQGRQDIRKKPHPDLYLHALATLGVSAADVVAIEDSPAGARGAVAAHIATLVTTNRDTREHAAGDGFDGAALVLTGLGTPDQPATVLQSAVGALAAGERTVVDLPMLRALLPQ